jgi:rsbT co-antagonist protein RsbR
VPEGLQGVKEGARDIWDVWSPDYEAVTEELRVHFASHPQMGPLFAQPDEAETARSRALIEAAMCHGEWDRYWQDVRVQASGYAQFGIRLSVWAELIGELRTALTRRLLQRFLAEPDRLLAALQVLDRWLDRALGEFADTFVSVNEDLIENQQRAIRELSTPVLQVRPGLVIMPIVGELDIARVEQVQGQLLSALRDTRARAVVIDVTAVPAIDSQVAARLMATVEAARLMGTEVVVSGLSADLAQALVNLGLDVGRLRSVGDLQGGIELAEQYLLA